MCKEQKKFKVEAYLFIRESLNFLRRRSNWVFFNGLIREGVYKGMVLADHERGIRMMQLSQNHSEHLELGKLLVIQHRLEQDQRVLAAYLLGSAASGRMRSDSDLDLALMTMPDAEMSSLERIALAADLGLDLGIVVDIGELSSRNLVYAKEAILTGRRIFTRDRFQADLKACTLLGMYVRFNEERHEVLNAYRAR